MKNDHVYICSKYKPYKLLFVAVLECFRLLNNNNSYVADYGLDRMT